MGGARRWWQRRGGWRPSSRWIVLAFLAVTVSFVAGTIAVEGTAAKIGAAASGIANDEAAGIQYLVAAQNGVRRAEAFVERQIRARQLDRSIDVLARLRRGIDEMTEKFLSLPVSDEEARGWQQVVAALSSFDSRVSDALAASRARDWRRATALLPSIHESADRAVQALLEMTMIDGRDAQLRAADIAQLHRRSLLYAIILDGACILLATLATALVIHSVKHGRQLLEAHAHLLEDRANELEQFSGRVAHDILSPLSAVALAIELARRKGSTAPLERADSSMRRVRQIVDGLLGFARADAGAGPGQRAVVRAVMDDLLEEVRPAAISAAVAITVEPPPPDVAVACAAGVLASILSNLVNNAIKYMGTSTRRQVILRVKTRGRTVRFEVEDTGPGIPQDMAERIFEPYYRGRHAAGLPGIGLGLATVRRLAQRHGGETGARGAPGGGSLFWVELARA